MALGNQNKVKYMATQLLAKFEENAPPQSTGLRRQVNPILHLAHPHLVWPHRKEGAFQLNETRSMSQTQGLMGSRLVSAFPLCECGR